MINLFIDIDGHGFKNTIKLAAFGDVHVFH
jgi:hypothetical protein